MIIACGDFLFPFFLLLHIRLHIVNDDEYSLNVFGSEKKCPANKMHYLCTNSYSYSLLVCVFVCSFSQYFPHSHCLLHLFVYRRHRPLQSVRLSVRNRCAHRSREAARLLKDLWERKSSLQCLHVYCGGPTLRGHNLASL